MRRRLPSRPGRIQFKVAVFYSLQMLRGLAPRYLGPLTCAAILYLADLYSALLARNVRTCHLYDCQSLPVAEHLMLWVPKFGTVFQPSIHLQILLPLYATNLKHLFEHELVLAVHGFDYLVGHLKNLN